MSWRFTGWVDSGTLVFSSRPRWAFTPSPSRADKTKDRWPNPADELQKLGGAAAILATVTNAEAMSSLQGGLAINGTLLAIGAVPSMQINPIFLLNGRRSVRGWYSGTSIDSQDTLAFSSRTGVRSMNETLPLERVVEAYERMVSGKARFRVVLQIAK